ncbi:hypothetical protein GCM10023336_04350 [Streptomyces similanensis]|uniref:Uncharacterized protein n=1 Tax=Streptomyces similanensis TaxID=1274988 RepID=A0ABP9JSA2_9ACTN
MRRGYRPGTCLGSDPAPTRQRPGTCPAATQDPPGQRPGVQVGSAAFAVRETPWVRGPDASTARLRVGGAGPSVCVGVAVAGAGLACVAEAAGPARRRAAT